MLRSARLARTKPSGSQGPRAGLEEILAAATNGNPAATARTAPTTNTRVSRAFPDRPGPMTPSYRIRRSRSQPRSFGRCRQRARGQEADLSSPRIGGRGSAGLPPRVRGQRREQASGGLVTRDRHSLRFLLALRLLYGFPVFLFSALVFWMRLRRFCVRLTGFCGVLPGRSCVKRRQPVGHRALANISQTTDCSSGSSPEIASRSSS
jgi:hypothetical protein